MKSLKHYFQTILYKPCNCKNYLTSSCFFFFIFSTALTINLGVNVLIGFTVVFMFLGALGYFFFTYNFLFNVSTDQLFFKRFSYWSLHILYLLVFIPSMLWIGQTIKYIDTGSMADWVLVVTMLLTVAMASIFLFLFTIDLRVEKNTFMYLASVIGAAVFTFHTLFLDGLIWISFFHKTN